MAPANDGQEVSHFVLFAFALVEQCWTIECTRYPPPQKENQTILKRKWTLFLTTTQQKCHLSIVCAGRPHLGKSQFIRFCNSIFTASRPQSKLAYLVPFNVIH
jgi:hypothetical protein